MNSNQLLNEVLEGLHFGQVIEFTFCGQKYALESYQLEGNDHHSLCLYSFEEGDPQGKLVFSDKISYFGKSDYPRKFEDNYPIDEIKLILEKEKAFNGKNFFDAFDKIDIDSID